MVPWEKELTNNPEILETLCQRLSNDYEQTHQKIAETLAKAIFDQTERKVKEDMKTMAAYLADVNEF
ncbi:unnamed protein product, partial [Durusdinium trenchii]